MNAIPADSRPERTGSTPAAPGLSYVRVAAIITVLLTIVSGGEAKQYRSPDGALVTAVFRSGPGSEHRVEIRDRHGNVLVNADHGSDDGEHGLVVDRAAWSPDSGFFLFSTYSSGGHRAEDAGYATFLIRDHFIEKPFGHQLAL